MTNVTKLKIGGTEYSIDYDSLVNKYSLPTASTSTLGGVKVDGSTITITDGVISSSDAVSDVKINGTSILSSGVADIPHAGATNAGVIKSNTSYGTSTNSDGVLQAETKTYAEYNSTADTMFIGKGTLNNVIAGKELETSLQSITDASTITLANNTIYTGDTLTALTIALPSTYDAKFAAQLNFTSGSTATTWSAPSTIKFIGNDCSSNSFTPVASKEYVIFVYATSSSTARGVVSGIATT